MNAQALDRLLALLNSGAGTAVYNVDSSLAEVEDLLSYCNDILCTGTHAHAYCSAHGVLTCCENKALRLRHPAVRSCIWTLLCILLVASLPCFAAVGHMPACLPPEFGTTYNGCTYS